MRKSKKMFYLFVLIIIFTVSVGYAILNSNIVINGISEVKKNSWDLHFDNIQITSGSVEPIKKPTIDNTKLAIDFSFNLDLPGDFYEFSVDVVNAGTMDAIIESVSMNPGLTEEQKNYLNYNILYENGNEVFANQFVLASSSVKLIVRVEYRTDIVGDVLPSEYQTIDLGFIVNYVQGDSRINGNLNVYSFSWSQAPGFSIYDAVNLKYDEMKNINKDIIYPKALEYSLTISDGPNNYFIDEEGTILNLKSTIIVGGKTYKSTYLFLGANVSAEDYDAKDHITLFVDVKQFYDEGLINKVIYDTTVLPAVVKENDTYVNVIHSLYPDIDSKMFISSNFAKDFEQEIVNDYIFAYPESYVLGCKDDYMHRFYSFTDENGNIININDNVNQFEKITMLSFSFSENETTYEEARDYVVEQINLMFFNEE